MAYTITGYSGGSLEASPLNATIKYEPMSPASVSSTSSSGTVGVRRKRNASQASLNQVQTTTNKLKKYQMNPENDPSVRNAIAAKNNREKKKQEFHQTKKQLEDLQVKYKELEERNEMLSRENEIRGEKLKTVTAENERYKAAFGGWMEILDSAIQQEELRPLPDHLLVNDLPMQQGVHAGAVVHPGGVVGPVVIGDEPLNQSLSPSPGSITFAEDSIGDPVFGYFPTYKDEAPTLPPGYDYCDYYVEAWKGSSYI